MSEKVVLITGASSGIGEASAYLFAKNGFKVAIHGLTEKKVNKVVDECLKISPGHIGICLDFADPINGSLAVKKTIDHYKRLDVLINNAGLYLSTNVDDAEVFQKYKKLTTINTESAISASLEAIKYLKKTKGNIVFVGSTAGAQPSENRFGYSMSKAALTMFAKSLAIDLAPDIRVNIVSPGPTYTDIGRHEYVNLSMKLIEMSFGKMNLAKRIGRSNEVANAIYFVASSDASYIYGNEMFVDGGRLLKR